MKKILSILILCMIGFANSTCKKASTHHINLCGEWVSTSGCEMGIVINKDNTGSYRSYNKKNGCGVKNWDGKFYITNTQLRLEKASVFGSITFRFIEKPKLYNGSDSITSRTLTGDEKSLASRKIIATMILKNPGTYNDAKIKYYKIVDY